MGKKGSHGRATSMSLSLETSFWLGVLQSLNLYRKGRQHWREKERLMFTSNFTFSPTAFSEYLYCRLRKGLKPLKLTSLKVCLRKHCGKRKKYWCKPLIQDDTSLRNFRCNHVLLFRDNSV